ncbi:crosslink repair DNA glycosylase YcaQ family protein, partial [Streptosporangium canum]|uniref:DNA glycosylase AlkZ-like family protein n=1 Tax=Streptosporangium canum TaxID=324952 RepID=UPI0034331AFE
MSIPTSQETRLSWSEVSARRLERHALSAPARDARPADVVAVMCGAHAQVLSAAELSIGLRIAGLTRTDVHQALWSERSLVKTFGPRGTVHLLPAGDLPMWTGALSALPSAGGHTKNARMTPEQTDEVVAAIAVALRDAELTADELSEVVIAATGPWAGDLVMPAFQGMWPRWRQALSTAANRGALCFGPNRGRKTTSGRYSPTTKVDAPEALRL